MLDSCSPDCRVPADIVFVVDASGSIGERNFVKARAFLAGVVGRMANAIDTDFQRVGMLTFGDGANLVFHLNQFTETLVSRAHRPMFRRARVRGEAQTRTHARTPTHINTHIGLQVAHLGPWRTIYNYKEANLAMSVCGDGLYSCCTHSHR